MLFCNGVFHLQDLFRSNSVLIVPLLTTARHYDLPLSVETGGGVLSSYPRWVANPGVNYNDCRITALINHYINTVHMCYAWQCWSEVNLMHKFASTGAGVVVPSVMPEQEVILMTTQGVVWVSNAKKIFVLVS